jgi:hypothetical protein
MARISTYVIDPVVTENDKWIGTDFSGGITKNFTPKDLANFFNESSTIGIVNQLNFKYYQTFIGDRPIGSITTLNQSPLFSSLTSIKLSEKNSGLKYIVNILNTLVGETIMISDTSNPNFFGIYKLISINEDLQDAGFYNVLINFIEGNGNLNNNHVYGITSISDSSSIDKHYTHIQSSPLNPWIVNHNLNKFPSATIVLSTGQVGIADVKYIDENNLTITFSGDESGKAYMN